MEDHPPSAALSGLLEDARRRLVETGTRNRLIHVNRSARRANVLDVDCATIGARSRTAGLGTRAERQRHHPSPDRGRM